METKPKLKVKKKPKLTSLKKMKKPKTKNFKTTNKTINNTNKVKVFVRFRPLISKSEHESGLISGIPTKNDEEEQQKEEVEQQQQQKEEKEQEDIKMKLKKKIIKSVDLKSIMHNREKQFSTKQVFNEVFPSTVNNESVYKSTLDSLIQSQLDLPSKTLNNNNNNNTSSSSATTTTSSTLKTNTSSTSTTTNKTLQPPQKTNNESSSQSIKESFLSFFSSSNENGNNGNNNKTNLKIKSSVSNNNTICFFGYGHSGSGKTHTILGYGKEYGMYYHSVKKYINFISDKPSLYLKFQFIEIHNDKVYDLLNKRKECFLRTDSNGNIQIRGTTETNYKEKTVSVSSLSFKYCKTIEEAKQILDFGIKQRITGTSAMHDQSSRSHAILQVEIVSNELIKAREKVLQRIKELSPVGYARDDFVIKECIKLYKIDPITKQYIKIENKKITDQLNYLENQFKIFTQRVEDAKNEEIEIKKRDKTGLLTSNIVFIDLAGADFDDSINNNKFSKEELKEFKQINQSLLALKECIRSIKLKKKHIPFRNSKLTMFLKRFLISKNSTVVMLATVSQCDNHFFMTTNTLKYANLVANC